MDRSRGRHGKPLRAEDPSILPKCRSTQYVQSQSLVSHSSRSWRPHATIAQLPVNPSVQSFHHDHGHQCVDSVNVASRRTSHRSTHPHEAQYRIAEVRGQNSPESLTPLRVFVAMSVGASVWESNQSARARSTERVPKCAVFHAMASASVSWGPVEDS